MGTFCFGAFIIMIILGIIGGILDKSPTPGTNTDFDPFDPERDPYANETLLAILEDDNDIIDWTGNGPGL